MGSTSLADYILFPPGRKWVEHSALASLVSHVIPRPSPYHSECNEESRPGIWWGACLLLFPTSYFPASIAFCPPNPMAQARLRGHVLCDAHPPAQESKTGIRHRLTAQGGVLWVTACFGRFGKMELSGTLSERLKEKEDPQCACKERFPF